MINTGGIMALALVYAAILAWRIPTIYRNYGKRDLLIYVIATIISFTLPLLLLMDIDIPNPTDFLNRLLMEFARNFFTLPDHLEPDGSQTIKGFLGQSAFPSWYHKGYNVQ